MSPYILRRLLLIVPTFLLVTLIVFFLSRFIPGSVIDQLIAEMGAAGGGTDATRAQLEAALGLDVPIYIQYGRWLAALLQGDLGNSLWTGVPVLEDILARIPVTLELGILALFTGLLISLPIGVYSAMRQDTGRDYIGRTIAIVFISVPGFWIGTMVVVYPSIWWHWSPPIQYIPLVEDPIGNFKQFIIPAVILGMVMSGATMRMTRTMMLEVLRQDYIRTAWEKGLPEWAVVLGHAVKNALIPVVTVIGTQIPILIAGSVIIEQIFVLPGIGLLLIEALSKRNYPVISGVCLFTAITVLIVNLAIDITYSYLDPRIRHK